MNRDSMSAEIAELLRLRAEAVADKGRLLMRAQKAERRVRELEAENARLCTELDH